MYIYVYIYIGWWFQPVWKIWKSVGLIIHNIWKVIKKIHGSSHHHPEGLNMDFQHVYIAKEHSTRIQPHDFQALRLRARRMSCPSSGCSTIIQAVCGASSHPKTWGPSGDHGGFRAFQGKKHGEHDDFPWHFKGISNGTLWNIHGICMEMKQCMRDGNILGYVMAFHAGYEIEYSCFFSTKNQCR